MTNVYDVFVVGAGPSGSLFSALLSKQGLSVRMVDISKEVKRKVCGEYLCPLGVDLIYELGLEFVLKDFKFIKGMDIYSPNGTEVKCKFPKTSKANYGLSLNRQLFDTRLLDYARICGTEISLATQIVSFEYNDCFWLIKSLNGEEFRSRVLVGADGRRSFVAKTIGATIAQESHKIAIHCWVKVTSAFERSGQMHLFEDGSYIGIDPITDEEVNISLVCDAKLVREKKTILEVLNSFIQKSDYLHENIGVLSDQKIYTISPVSHKVGRLKVSNLALIGDAAGFIDPLTGEGIFNGIWMAKNLAENLSTSGTIFDSGLAISNYNREKDRFFMQKKITNYFFQWLILKPVLIEKIAVYLAKKQSRADSFVGVIGNVYRPLVGLLKILF